MRDPVDNFDEESRRRDLKNSELPTNTLLVNPDSLNTGSAIEYRTAKTAETHGNSLPSLELTLPKALEAQWHSVVLATIRRAPVEIRQSLLDELDGQLSIPGKRIYNPPGWLQSLIQRHKAGGFLPAMSDKVSADRQSRDRVAGQVANALAKAVAGATNQPAKTNPVEPSIRTAAAVEALAKLRKSIVRGKA